MEIAKSSKFIPKIEITTNFGSQKVLLTNNYSRITFPLTTSYFLAYHFKTYVITLLVSTSKRTQKMHSILCLEICSSLNRNTTLPLQVGYRLWLAIDASTLFSPRFSHRQSASILATVKWLPGVLLSFKRADKTVGWKEFNQLVDILWEIHSTKWLIPFHLSRLTTGFQLTSKLVTWLVTCSVITPSSSFTTFQKNSQNWPFWKQRPPKNEKWNLVAFNRKI